MQLTVPELRVLGALIEKEITTPENYPLSLNALEAAANQRSSRDPVLELGEEELRQALHGLEERGLVTPVRDSRVPKWEHRARTVLNLRRDETAVLCLLLLRGPQTPGELRSRADRLYTFDDLGSVTSTLDRLAARPPAEEGTTAAGSTGPLTAALPRPPRCPRNPLHASARHKQGWRTGCAAAARLARPQLLRRRAARRGGAAAAGAHRPTAATGPA